jgi:hypothetical protein
MPTDPAQGFAAWRFDMRATAATADGRQVGLIRLSLFSTAQPLYARFPIIFSTCFSKVTIGYHPTARASGRPTRGPLGPGPRPGPSIRSDRMLPGSG